MALEKSRHSEQYFTEKVQTEESANKIKENRLNEANNVINKLQIEIIEKDEKLANLKNEMSRALSQIEYVKEQLANSKEEQSKMESEIEFLN